MQGCGTWQEVRTRIETGETTTPNERMQLTGLACRRFEVFANSGGDYMPYTFRQAKLGKKTWGGLVGIGGYPALLDGSSVTAPD